MRSSDKAGDQDIVNFQLAQKYFHFDVRHTAAIQAVLVGIKTHPDNILEANKILANTRTASGQIQKNIMTSTAPFEHTSIYITFSKLLKFF